jgi:hypothetical protein
MPMGGHWPYLQWPCGGPDGGPYDSGAFNRPARRLAVRVPRAAAIDTPPAFSPTGSRRAQHLDAGDYPFAQLIAEHLQQAAAQQPELRGPCRGVATHMQGGVSETLRCAVGRDVRANQGLPFRHDRANGHGRRPTAFCHQTANDVSQTQGITTATVELSKTPRIAQPFRFGAEPGRGARCRTSPRAEAASRMRFRAAWAASISSGSRPG